MNDEPSPASTRRERVEQFMATHRERGALAERVELPVEHVNDVLDELEAAWASVGRVDTAVIGSITRGARMAVEERQRQIDVEGYDADHDADHEVDELAQAAIAYAATCVDQDIRIMQENGETITLSSRLWPWGGDFKGDDQDIVKRLTIAAGLAIAALDRALAD